MVFTVITQIVPGFLYGLYVIRIAFNPTTGHKESYIDFVLF